MRVLLALLWRVEQMNSSVMSLVQEIFCIAGPHDNICVCFFLLSWARKSSRKSASTCEAGFGQ